MEPELVDSYIPDGMTDCKDFVFHYFKGGQLRGINVRIWSSGSDVDYEKEARAHVEKQMKRDLDGGI